MGEKAAYLMTGGKQRQEKKKNFTLGVVLKFIPTVAYFLKLGHSP